MKYRLFIKVLCYFFFLFCFPIKVLCASPFIDHNTYTNKLFLSAQVENAYLEKNSLLNNQANDIVQTPDGAIWIASYAGLFRFDGNQLMPINKRDYPNFDSLASRDLFVGEDGTLWIGSNDRGLFSLRNGSMQHYEMRNELTNSIRGLFSDNQNLYVMTTNGLGHVNGNAVERIPLDIAENEYFISGTVGSDDTLYLINRSGSLITAFLDGSNSQKVDLDDAKAKSVLLNGDILYIGMDNGSVYFFNTKTGYIDKKIQLSNMTSINSMFIDRDKRVWFCSNSGVGYLTQDLVFHNVSIDKKYSQFQYMTQDYEGNLWFAIYAGGIFKLSPSKFIDIFSDNNIHETSVNATAVYHQTLYIATNYGLKIIGDNGEEFNHLTQALTGQRIRGLYLDARNNLWICSYKTGLYRVTGGEISGHWSIKEGLPSVRTRTVVTGDDGTVYVATVAGLAVIKDDKVVKTYTVKDGLKTDFILSLELAKDKLYIGTDGSGLYQLDIKSDVISKVSKNIDVSVVLRSKVDPITGVVFLTSSDLYMIFPDGSVKTFSHQIFDGDIYDIQIYGRSLVLVASKGIYIVKIADLMVESEEELTYYALGAPSGLSASTVANAWNYLSTDGKFYICTREGVLFLNLSTLSQKDNIAPKIGINKILIDSKLNTHHSNIELDADVQKIDFILSVFSFNGAEKNSIKFQLKGFDKKPRIVKPSENVSISYTNLDGGDYTFTFTGINSSGVESVEPITISIHKAYSLYERTETYIIIGLILICITYLISRWWMGKKQARLIKERNRYHAITNGSIEVISRTIDAKDDYTHGHSKRVADYSVLIAKEVGFEEKELEKLYYTGLLHDIGKISIPDRILNKPGRLTPDELKIMQSHALRGYEILQDFEQADYLCEGALYHHERYDGTGYPHQLVGTDIPLHGRILTIADSYDAMATDRPYRKGLPEELVIEEFEKGRGKQFDPELIDIMIRLLDTKELKAVLQKTPSHA